MPLSQVNAKKVKSTTRTSVTSLAKFHGQKGFSPSFCPFNYALIFDRLLIGKYLLICSEQEHHLRIEVVSGAFLGVTELDIGMFTEKLEHEIYLLTWSSLQFYAPKMLNEQGFNGRHC